MPICNIKVATVENCIYIIESKLSSCWGIKCNYHKSGFVNILKELILFHFFWRGHVFRYPPLNNDVWTSVLDTWILRDFYHNLVDRFLIFIFSRIYTVSSFRRLETLSMLTITQLTFSSWKVNIFFYIRLQRLSFYQDYLVPEMVKRFSKNN